MPLPRLEYASLELGVLEYGEETDVLSFMPKYSIHGNGGVSSSAENVIDTHSSIEGKSKERFISKEVRLLLQNLNVYGLTEYGTSELGTDEQEKHVFNKYNITSSSLFLPKGTATSSTDASAKGKNVSRYVSKPVADILQNLEEFGLHDYSSLDFTYNTFIDVPLYRFEIEGKSYTFASSNYYQNTTTTIKGSSTSRFLTATVSDILINDPEYSLGEFGYAEYGISEELSKDLNTTFTISGVSYFVADGRAEFSSVMRSNGKSVFTLRAVQSEPSVTGKIEFALGEYGEFTYASELSKELLKHGVFSVKSISPTKIVADGVVPSSFALESAGAFVPKSHDLRKNVRQRSEYALGEFAGTEYAYHFDGIPQLTEALSVGVASTDLVGNYLFNTELVSKALSGAFIKGNAFFLTSLAIDGSSTMAVDGLAYATSVLESKGTSDLWVDTFYAKAGDVTSKGESESTFVLGEAILTEFELETQSQLVFNSYSNVGLFTEAGGLFLADSGALIHTIYDTEGEASVTAGPLIATTHDFNGLGTSKFSPSLSKVVLSAVEVEGLSFASFDLINGVEVYLGGHSSLNFISGVDATVLFTIDAPSTVVTAQGVSIKLVTSLFEGHSSTDVIANQKNLSSLLIHGNTVLVPLSCTVKTGDMVSSGIGTFAVTNVALNNSLADIKGFSELDIIGFRKVFIAADLVSEGVSLSNVLTKFKKFLMADYASIGLGSPIISADYKQYIAGVIHVDCTASSHIKTERAFMFSFEVDGVSFSAWERGNHVVITMESSPYSVIRPDENRFVRWRQ